MPRAENTSDFQKIIEVAKSHDWTVRQTSKGHWCFLSPDKVTMVHTGGSPSDFRAIRNLVARLRQRGLNIPNRGTGKAR